MMASPDEALEAVLDDAAVPVKDAVDMPPPTPAIADDPVEAAIPAAAASLPAAAVAAASPLPDRAPAAASSSSSDSGSESSTSSSPLRPGDLGGDADAGGACLSSSSDDDEEGELVARLRQQLSIGDEAGVQLAKEALLPSFDLAGVAQLIQSGKAKRIICMCGAGISVSAGIPDFRSPGTGLYSQLQKYNLPYPHAVFELSYFEKKPKPFFRLARELFPGNYLPTPTHYFMKLLHEKGLLLRCFTQNIDSLEKQAGLPAEAIVAAHGNFDSAKCIRCARPHPVEHVRQAVFAGDGGKACYCVKKSCGGLVKPEIVFFGENLPPRFWERAPLDYSEADLLIVMGTSLAVHPFAGLIDYVHPHVPRLLVNREKAGEAVFGSGGLLSQQKGFTFGAGNYRDALYLGDCDDGVRQLCELLGWQQELDALVAAGRQQLEAAAQQAKAKS